MSDPKCGLLGNVWLDTDTQDGILYQPDTLVKKAVGTVTITPSGLEEYTYTGLWQDNIQYEYGMVAKFSGRLIVAKTSVSAGTLPTDETKWGEYLPQAVTLYAANANYSGDFVKADASNFMIIFQGFVNSWDGTTMIPGVVISPTNKLFAVRVASADNSDSVVIGFNGIEEYL
jgi:hypothetical protein